MSNKVLDHPFVCGFSARSAEKPHTKKKEAPHMSEGSEYDRLFYPFLFAGGTASAEDVLAQVRHSTLEKCREVVALRRATLAQQGARIVEAGVAMARAFAEGATLLA